MSEENSGSIFSGFLWMSILSLLLIWLPTFGPLIAGVVGGKKAGGVMAGILAALLPVIIFGTLMFFAAASLTGIPVLGAIAGMGGVALVIIHIGPLLVGAIVGGALA